MGEGTFPIPDILTSHTTPHDLAIFLGTSYSKIKYFYYTKPIADSYSTFHIAKKSGGQRTITAPNDRLKVLQKRIKILLTGIYNPKRPVTAFVKDSSLSKNAQPHCRKKFVFNIDLQDFFPSISFSRVRGLLISKPYSLSPETATVIAHLATVNGVLPQGAPSSPVISNMICASLDYQLLSLAMKYGASYTRYADDITISFHCPLEYIPQTLVDTMSSTGRINHHQAKPGTELLAIIARNGFQINTEKVRLQSCRERQIVTGLVVNKKPNVDRRYIRKTSALIHSIEKFGTQGSNLLWAAKLSDTAKADEQNKREGTPLEAHIQGRLLFIHQIVGPESVVYTRLANRFNVLPTNFKVPKPQEKKDELEKNIKISKFITNKCWIVEIWADKKLPDGTNEPIIIQGSAFAIAEGFLVTCAHVVSSDNVDINECEVYLASNQSEAISAKVIHRNNIKDIAFLAIENKPSPFETFVIEYEREPSIGEQVAILGFPNRKKGSAVGHIRAKITNKYPLNIPSVQHSEVDKMLYPGNSGGPVINSSNHVVGIASKGAAGTDEGQNSFINASELISELAQYNHNRTQALLLGSSPVPLQP